MTNDVSNVPDLDDTRGAIALRTPLYPIISVFGVVMFIAAFLPWATVPRADGSGNATSVSGLDAGGWGAATLVVGLIIVILADLGYFWNPFSDPEAIFIAVFAALALVASIVKVFDVGSFLDPDGQFADVKADVGIGLWLVVAAAAVSLLGALWILYSRPRAQARLAG